ncbi:ribosome maturation factor RimM [Phenylobacterium sp.]|jgi:16S rRNA processing protein RimM|uniref:ribosome maturation factor RimM n=1 Tax=Phenylobacterium sp. TaxID=1871053 RepID=UPI002E2FC07C|nr:ribosome maturation factor RimM [Phenylobacterium sp.]HEX2561833.1 ribosome maturation factor RimM [Phenylobacterium sp.]
MAERLILVGRVAGAFGVKGELRISSYTEDPMALVRYRVLLREDGAKALTLTGGRPVKGGVIVRADEVPTREAAEALRGLRLHVSRDALPPPEDEDEFYLADLIGLLAETAEGEVLGRVKSIHDFGAGDLLEIQPPEGPSWWLPFTREAVPEVRIAEGKVIAVRPEETE